MGSLTRPFALSLLLVAACTGEVIEPKRTEVYPGTRAPDAGANDTSDGGDPFPDDVDQPRDTPDASDDDPVSSQDSGAGLVDAGPVNPEPMDPLDPSDPCADGSEALASQLRIQEIAIYQTVKVPLAQNGVWLAQRPAPVVQGKDAFVRVFVEPLTGFSPHTVRAVLTLDDGVSPQKLATELNVTSPSSDGARNSTFNFEVPGALIGPNTSLSVALVETSCPSSLGNASDARFPVSGNQRLDAEKIGPLNVVVVPMVVGGLVPDTSDAQLSAMRAALLAYYPVPDVRISVRDAVPTNINVSANGTGWSDVLDLVLNVRAQDRPADDVYYYGIMTPVSSFASYCREGCVLGLAPQTVFRDPDHQGGLGVGYLGVVTPETMVHELAHAHGRGHAPCVQGGTIEAVDPSFPYQGGAVGVWGWDSRDGSLMNPSLKDIMGYCSPTWISDYTYDALARRARSVNVAARIAVPESATWWQGILLYADGTARYGALTTRHLPGGELEQADVLDATGRFVERITVARVRLSHLDDQRLYVPPIEPEWSRIVLSDRTLELADVMPAR